MAAIVKLPSGSWRAQVRRKGKYVTATFLRRKDADEWALATERNIDRGVLPNSPDPKSVRTLASIIDLHIRETGSRPNGSANNLKEFYHEIVTADLRGDLFNQQRSMEGGISCQSADCTIGPEAYTIAHEYLLIDVVSIQLFIIQALVSIKFAEQN